MNIHKLFLISALMFSSVLRADLSQEPKASTGIFAGSVAAACLYGIAHDQVTARVCPEYFTEGFHKDMVGKGPDGWLKKTLLTTKSPTKLGLLWGTLETWCIAQSSCNGCSSRRFLAKAWHEGSCKAYGASLGCYGSLFLYGGPKRL